MSTQATETPAIEPTIPEDTIANRLMLARRHLSIRRAALQCGIGRGTWQNWENGVREPRLSELRQIADGLHVRFDWLAEGGPLANPKPSRGPLPDGAITAGNPAETWPETDRRVLGTVLPFRPERRSDQRRTAAQHANAA